MKIAFQLAVFCWDIVLVKYNESTDIAEFEVLSDMKGVRYGFLRQIPEDNKLLKEDYLLPNYIADCSKSIGFNGILYSSIHDTKNLGHNYVFLNYEKDKDLIIINIATENILYLISNINVCPEFHLIQM